MRKIFIILLLNIVFLYTGAQTYNASVKFYIENVSGTVEGTLEGFDGDINFNPANPEKSEISASVQVSSIDTGIKLRDKHLRNKNFFWADKYPEIRMEALDINKTDEGKYKGVFNLNIKGTTRRIDLPFSYTRLGNTEQFQGAFTINRVDFDVGGNALLYGEEVRVEIELKVININS